ncbi:MAG: cupin domain-containing protein [Acidimicrobiales bacterium]
MPDTPMSGGTEAWHRPLHHTPAGELSEDTVQTPGMRRREGILERLGGATKIWMGESLVAGGARSADHHHGESETSIYVASGHPVFVFAEDGVERRVETGPGDYVFVPPFVPHREENPHPDEPATVVLARSTQEAIVINLTGLDDPAGRPIPGEDSPAEG